MKGRKFVFSLVEVVFYYVRQMNNGTVENSKKVC